MLSYFLLRAIFAAIVIAAPFAAGQPSDPRRCKLEKRAKNKGIPECNRRGANLSADLSLCVGIRGNGPRLFAHFPALARIVEAFGPIQGMSGGSSGTVTAFVLESISSNPLVVQCGEETCCSFDEQRARISFFLKSVEGLPADSVDFSDSLGLVLGKILVQGIPTRLQSTNRTVQEGAVDDLIVILEDAQGDGNEAASLINPDLIDLLENSPDPVYHANDIITASSGDFSVKGDPLVFIRPYLLNFDGASEFLDVVASFFSGFDPVNTVAMSKLLQNCATASLGLKWAEIKFLQATEVTTCGEDFVALFEAFVDERTSSHPTRLDDPLGSTIATLINTSVLLGAGYNLWNDAVETYKKADPVNHPVLFEPGFGDVKFGYYGDRRSLNRIRARLSNLFDDTKTERFLSMGEVPWREVLRRSPAEPTLSNGVPIIEAASVTLGGWVDMTPSQVLTAMGCDRIILVNRPDGIGSFVVDVASLLGINQEGLDDLFDLEDPESAWMTSLSAADASICADWDAPNGTDVEALADAGYEGPLLSDDPCILALRVGATNEERIVGCSPLVE